MDNRIRDHAQQQESGQYSLRLMAQLFEVAHEYYRCVYIGSFKKHNACTALASFAVSEHKPYNLNRLSHCLYISAKAHIELTA